MRQKLASRVQGVDLQGLLQTLSIVAALLLIVWGAERRMTVIEEQHKYMIEMLQRQNVIIEQQREMIQILTTKVQR